MAIRGAAAAAFVLLLLAACSQDGGFSLGGGQLNPVSATLAGEDPAQGDAINVSQGSVIP